MERCTKTNHPRYKDYGAKGITVCEEWKDLVTFYNWCIANGYKPGLQLDREQNEGNYEPSNCRFVSSKINNNNKGNHLLICYKGVTKNLAQWAEELNLNYSMLLARLKRHNPTSEQLFEVPNRYAKFKASIK